MDPRTLTRPLRVLRACLHLLVVGLLALVAVRALLAHLPHAAWVIVVAMVMATVYAAGPLLPAVGRSRRAAAAWLTALGAVWLALLWLTPDGVYLAFPLFFLQLHLLPVRWGLPAVGATTALAIAGFSWHQTGVTAAAVIGPALGAAVAVATVLGYQALYVESERRRDLIEELTAARNELAAAERVAGVHAERERLAAEIHDTLAQGLSSIQLLLRAAERALPDRADGAAAHIERARAEAQHNLAEARRFVHALSPPDLENGSLPAALERLCTTTSEHSGLTVGFQLDGDPATVPTPQEVALLRIAQSALGNAVQHANAGRADLALSYTSSRIALSVVDNGVGFEPAALPGADDSGFGLAGMRARAHALGGTVTVQSAPGNGTALTASFVRDSQRPA